MRRTRHARLTLMLLIAASLGAPGAALAREAAPQAAANLLTNGGFEGGAAYAVGTVASGWTPWWQQGSESQQAAGLGVAPTYELASRAVAPNGVLEGNTSQAWKHTYATAPGGVYQRVTVPANALVRLEVYGRGYSCDLPAGTACPGTSSRPAALNMQAGLDLFGRTDFNADGVIKTAGRSPYDTFQRFSVEGRTGSSTTVTVFLAYQPGSPARVSQVWWDQATLTVISGGEATAGATATTTPGATATTTPIPEGAYVVQGGDSLFGIARAHNTTAADIIALNSTTYPGLLSNPDVIYAGWVLLMPAGATTPSTTTTGTDTTTTAGATTGGETTTETPPQSIPGETYVVQAGDSLLKIARETGVGVPELIALNEAVYPTLRTQPDVIYVGWVLKLK